MKTMKIALVVALAVSLVACCACRRNRSAVPLQGAQWAMIQMDGKAVESEKGYRITFGEDGRVSGVGDCNRFSGTFSLEGGDGRGSGALKVADDMVSTRMMCLNQAQEDRFLAVLREADSFSIDGEKLMLLRMGDVLAIFEVVPATPEVPTETEAVPAAVE